MNEQTNSICYIQKKILDPIYEWKFILKIVAVSKNDIVWYKRTMNSIETISAIIDTSLLSRNKRRAVRYCVILDCIIQELITKTNTDYERFLNNKLLE